MKILYFFLFVLPLIGFSQDSYNNTYNGEKIAHSRYSLSYIENHEQAEWVYYKLDSRLLTGITKRSNNFRSDPKIFQVLQKFLITENLDTIEGI